MNIYIFQFIVILLIIMVCQYLRVLMDNENQICIQIKCYDVKSKIRFVLVSFCYQFCVVVVIVVNEVYLSRDYCQLKIFFSFCYYIKMVKMINMEVCFMWIMVLEV